MKQVRWWPILALMAAFWLLPTAAWAQGGGGDQTIFGQSFTLPSGHTLDGNLAVFGGSATIEEKATVEGDIVIAGGSLDVAGRVDGDIALVGGSVTLRASAYVDGNVSVLGGTITRAPGAVVTGQVVTGLAVGQGGPLFPRPPQWTPQTLPELPRLTARADGTDLLVRAFLRLLGAFLLAALMAALAMIVLAFAPNASQRVHDALIVDPAVAFLLGLITLLLGGLVTALLAITLCLLPVALLLSLALLLALTFGWIIVGWLVGERLLSALNVAPPNPLLAAVIGTALLTLAARTPCLGALVFLVGASFGLGAVVMSRAGTQTYQRQLPANRTNI